MKKGCPQIHLLRFRRWTRKGYAVFSGLKHNVTIGALHGGVIKRLSRKCDRFILWSEYFTFNNDDFTEGEYKDAILNELAQELPLDYQEGNECCCIPYFNPITYTSDKRSVFSLFIAFYLYKRFHI